MAAALIRLALVLFLAADDPGDHLVLDRDGEQGAVAFDHAMHVKARPAAACATCHHTNDAKGVIQLAKCGACHGPEGDPHNPQSRAFNEENRKTAFHEMCIGCHADLAKTKARTGPVDCADCHKRVTNR